MDIKWEPAEQLRAKLELAMKKNNGGEVGEERGMTLAESSGGERANTNLESEDGDEDDPVPLPVHTVRLSFGPIFVRPSVRRPSASFAVRPVRPTRNLALIGCAF
uniref:Uncharacterized protein n=1 Tax=Caenorhabditis japonica TaxID=281687 RepID=A0A8R1IHY5_CAEJA